MEKENSDHPDSIKKMIKRPRPVVFLLIDSWGVGQNQPGNVFFELKLKNFSSLIKKYPLALLDKSGQSSAERYASLGGQGLFTKALANANLSQLHLMESEKLTGAWHNFSGGRDFQFPGEVLKVIPSELGDREDNPKQVTTKITDLALSNIKKDTFDFIFVNLANLDLISETGDLEAAKAAAKLLDKNIGRLVSAVLKHQGLLVITAAYGRAESMINMATEMPDTNINNNPVPFIIVSEDYEGKTIGLADPINSDLSLLASAGTIEDVAPTILKILDIPLPVGLNGESLI